jgi:hypothetical protein
MRLIKETNKEATYVSAAAFNTFLEQFNSFGVNIPNVSSETMARLEALNSTGRVMSWNMVTRENNPIPKNVNSMIPDIYPRIIKGIERVDPILVIGNNELRMRIGKYPPAYCRACPASCAATPIAATDRLS